MKMIMTLSMPAVAAAVGLAWTPTAPSPTLTGDEIGATTTVEFPHATHVGFIPSCAACHSGVAAGDMYPSPTFCGSCHNGSIQPEVDWTPPPARPPTNQRFSHDTHMSQAGTECVDCHVETGSSDNFVQLSVVSQCRD